MLRMDALFEALLGIVGAVLEGLLEAVGDRVLEALAGALAKGFHQISAWFGSFLS